MKNKYDLAVNSSIIMNYPNEIIYIYKGEFKLESLNISTIVKGEIFFKWFPHPGVQFNAEVLNHLESNLLLFESDKIKLLINNEVLGECYVKSQNISNKHIIKGGFYNKLLFGDKTLTSKEFKFSVLNFEEFLGNNIEYIEKDRVTYSRSRILIKNDEFTIFIDKIPDFKSKLDLLKENGGYQILYNGKIIVHKKSYNFKQAHEILNIIGHFLSFISGKKNAPTFLTAIHDDVILYTDFTGYANHMYEYRASWSNELSTSYINDLFLNFHDIWKSNADNKSFLVYIIHWYTEINCNSGYSEGSLIMAQTALELLYNWLIVENKRLIIGKDSENISAANKMRLLISHLSINYDVPEKFTNLEKFKNDNKCIDAIDAIVQIRNAIVHSQEEKRKKLSEIHSLVIYEAVQLSLWYIELSLLYILKFTDEYTNRCSKEMSKLELPPWI